jgi:hypothetical protein
VACENINQSSQTSTCPTFNDPNFEFNLCDLLGIDIEAKALKIALADKSRKPLEDSSIDLKKSSRKVLEKARRL